MINKHILSYKYFGSFTFAVGDFNLDKTKKSKLFFGFMVGTTSGLAVNSFKVDKWLHFYLYIDLLRFNFHDADKLRFGFKVPIFPNLNYKTQMERLHNGK